MRITHVVENLNRGGLERVVIDLALAQKAAGHDCRVVCLYEEGLLAGELRAEGIAVDACGKGTGFDVKIMRKIISLRRQEVNKRKEEEEIMDLYLTALGMIE